MSRFRRFMRAPLFRDNDARIVFYVILAVSFTLVLAMGIAFMPPVGPAGT